MRPQNLAAALAFVAVSGIAGAASAQTTPAVPAEPESVARHWTRYDAAEVTIRDAAALVRVRPENRSDVAVSIVNPGQLPAPELRVSRGRLVIDGTLRRQIRSCRVNGADFEVVTSRQGRLHAAQLPVIELRVPEHAVVSAGGAVRLHLAPAETAEVSLSGCGDADIVSVAGEADVSVSGAGDLRLYEAGQADVRVAGAGDVILGVVRSGLTVSIAGAGDFTASRADGPTNIALQGAGDVTIRDGRATTLSVAIAGAGDVTHNGSVERLDAVILGGGDVRVRQVSGEVTRRVLGGGEVVVGR
ncbi:MAG TPA: DUF2807 domain-containing protein [Vitreimonas sp.]|nr:DUF2807 domain-containing protein [Vitreimonas sp.]